jgi:hypothetical protein
MQSMVNLPQPGLIGRCAGGQVDQSGIAEIEGFMGRNRTLRTRSARGRCRRRQRARPAIPRPSASIRCFASGEGVLRFLAALKGQRERPARRLPAQSRVRAARSPTPSALPMGGATNRPISKRLTPSVLTLWAGPPGSDYLAFNALSPRLGPPRAPEPDRESRQI